MRFDKTDLHLLYLLDADSRASLTDLAKALHCSRETINYRLKRLEREGVLLGYIGKLDFGKLGLTNFIVYLKLANPREAEYRQMVGRFAKKSYITWLASLGGSYDMVLEITASGVREFETCFSDMLGDSSQDILSYSISVRSFQETYGKKYLWPEKSADRTMRRKEIIGKPPRPMDGLDRRLITVIAQDARVSIIDASTALKEPPTTLSLRLKRLEADGIIEGYTTFSSIKQLGYTRFKTLITVRSFSKEAERGLNDFCRAHTNIYYFTKNIGNWNYEIEVDVSSSMEYQRFLIDFRSRFGGNIQDIESLTIFEEHKFCYWPYEK